MKALQQSLAKLESNDTQVLGVSMDSPFSNFDELQSAESEELRLPIPEDPHLVQQAWRQPSFRIRRTVALSTTVPVALDFHNEVCLGNFGAKRACRSSNGARWPG